MAMGLNCMVRERYGGQGFSLEPFSIRVDSALGYHLVLTPERAQTDKVQRFCEWARVRLHSSWYAQPCPP